MTVLKISHDRYYALKAGIEQESIDWAVIDRYTGDVVLLFQNPGDELLFLLRWA